MTVNCRINIAITGTLVIDVENKGNGQVVWSVTNTDFAPIADAAGVTLRVPGKTRFQSPDKKADLIIDWKERELNVALDPARFVLEPPAGLPMCGGN